MTTPDASVSTIPFCGACGWDVSNGQIGNAGNDLFCDSCGANLLAFGFAAYLPPEPVATPGASQVSFAFTDMPDTQDVYYTLNGGAATLDTDVVSPYVVIASTGQNVCLQVRNVVAGVPGPWSFPVCAVAL